MGLRQRLSLVVVAAILPLFALLLFGAVADRRIAIQSALTRTTDRAKLASAWQNDGFQHARDVLNVLRRATPAVLADPEQCHALVQQIALSYPQFTTVGFVQGDGLSHCLSLETGPLKFRDVALFHATMTAEAGALIRGSYMVGPVTGKPIVVLAEPLPVAAGETAAPGIAYVTLDLHWAADQARSFAEPNTETVSLLDMRQGTVLARFPDDPQLAGAAIPEGDLVRALRSWPEGGSTEAVDLDGEEKVFGFAPLDDGAGLLVAVGVSRDAVLAAANLRLLLGIVCAVTAALFAAAMAWLFADRTQVRAIRDLVDAARRLGAGDLKAQAALKEWQAPEFHTLSETLSHMAADIEAAQASLKESEQQLRMLADHSTDMIIRAREDGRRLFVSPACEKVAGWTRSEMLRLSSHDTIHPDDIAVVSDPRLYGETPHVFTYRMRHKQGHFIWVEGAARGLPTGPGIQRECIIVVRDVGQRIEAERRLTESEARYRLLEEQGTDMIFQLDRKLVHRYVSPACYEILGYTAPELTGTNPLGLVHPDDAARVSQVLRAVLGGEIERTSLVHRIQHREGHWIWIEAQLKTLTSAEPGLASGILGSLRDISIRKAAEEQLEAANRRLEALARVDGLTGLANRRTFDEKLAMEHPRAESSRQPLGLIMIDVDRFKMFNDRYGHLAGDECLRHVSRAIESVLYRPGDLAARYGGEEFVVLLPDTDEAGASRVAERIRQAVLALNLVHESSSVGVVSISAGVAVHVGGPGHRDPDQLVLHADRALYAAKARGRNGVACASLLPETLAGPQSCAA